MSANILYRVANGSNGFLYSDHNVVVGGGTLTAMFWLRIRSGGATSGTQFVFADDGGLGLLVTFSGANFGFTVYGAGAITEAATTRAVDTWYLVALVNDTVTNDVEFFVDGVSVGTANTATDQLNGIFWIGGDPALDAVADIEISSVAYYDNGKTASNLVALYAAGVHHDLDVTSGNWTGELPPLWWYNPIGTTLPDGAHEYAGLDPGGAVGNSGDGGDAYLAVYRIGVSYRSIATTAVKRIGTLAKYPPVKTFYRFPGTAGSYLRGLTSVVPRLVFPDGGGLASMSWRFWVRRPETPATTGGTLGQITAGDATVTVGLDATEHLVITVDDGSNPAETDTATDPMSGYTWYEVVITVDSATDTLQGWVGTEMVVTVDTSGLTFPDADTELTFTIGAEADGTNPIDADVGGIAVWDDVLTDEEIEDLADSGYDHDPRNPGKHRVFDPGDGTPPSGYTWVEEVVDDVVPGSGYDVVEGVVDEPLVVIGEVVSVTEPSSFRIWTAGTHRIGAYSSAWWDNINPDDWSLSYVTAAHEDVFGECPRIIKVEFREEGDGVLWLYTDATLQPGIGYWVTPPVDLSGDHPSAALYYTSGGASDYASASTSVAADLLFPGTGDLGSFTVLMWARQDTANGFNMWSSGTSGADLLSCTGSGRTSQDQELLDGGAVQMTNAIAADDDDSWHLFAWSNDTGGDMVGHYDGVEAFATPEIGNYATPQTDFVLFAGGGSVPVVAAEAGALRNIAIFDRQLSTAEIAALYAAGKDHDYRRPSGAWAGELPSIYWRRAASSGSVANIGSGGTCDLVLGGAVSSEVE